MTRLVEFRAVGRRGKEGRIFRLIDSLVIQRTVTRRTAEVSLYSDNRRLSRSVHPPNEQKFRVLIPDDSVYRLPKRAATTCQCHMDGALRIGGSGTLGG